MLAIIREFLHSVIIKPIGTNMTLMLLLLGSIAIFIGTIGDSHLGVSPGVAEAILKTGSAILGAGIFAIIMKSAQFTKVFKRHIYDVLYDPNKAFDIDILKEKWLVITQAVLEKRLPSFAHRAAWQIKKQLLDNDELQYHYEDLELKYDIAVDNDKNAIITDTLCTRLIISPNVSSPVVEQNVKTLGGKHELTSLLINGKDIDTNNLLETSNSDLNEGKFVLPLNESTNHGPNETIDRGIKFERTYKIIQNLFTEPYCLGIISRYTKGLTVKAKIDSNNYRLYLKVIGYETDLHYCPKDGDDFQRWTLPREHLLLPGQGFILIAIPIIEKE